MKLLKKVSVKEVKRAFVIPQLIRSQKGKGRYLRIRTTDEFAQKLAVGKKKGLVLTTQQLDRAIYNEYPKRLRSYDACDWYEARMQTKELGVWKRAGGLPLAWTNGSLAETATKIRAGIKTNSKQVHARARRAITDMIGISAGFIQKEKYLWPIVFSAGTGTNGRKGLNRKVKGDIDDGCMRSLALAALGEKEIKVYFGIPKKP